MVALLDQPMQHKCLGCKKKKCCFKVTIRGSESSAKIMASAGIYKEILYLNSYLLLTTRLWTLTLELRTPPHD